MGYGFDADDVAFLTSESGRAALAEVARRPLTDRIADVRAARAVAGERHAAAVLETVMLRRRAESKVDDSGEWLFTDEALQQATTSVVARYRARRFAGRDAHDVTCSVGTDLSALTEVALRCIGSDVDGVRLAMARHNLDVGRSRDAAPVVLARADALRPVSRSTAVLADPGRRDGGGRRRWRPRDLVPPLDELLAAYTGRDLAVKCAPGLDFDVVPEGAEIEIVSAGGTVREATLWLGELREPPAGGWRARTRASLLSVDGTAWSISDAEPDDCDVRPVGEWIVEPDGAVVRAGLVRQYATHYGLGQLDEHIAYLTGDRPPPGVRAFRVFEQGRYSEKALRSLVRRLGIGRVEILVRGLDVDPDALRKRLKPSGAGEVTFVLTRVGRKPTFFACHAQRC